MLAGSNLKVLLAELLCVACLCKEIDENSYIIKSNDFINHITLNDLYIRYIFKNGFLNNNIWKDFLNEFLEAKISMRKKIDLFNILLELQHKIFTVTLMGKSFDRISSEIFCICNNEHNRLKTDKIYQKQCRYNTKVLNALNKEIKKIKNEFKKEKRFCVFICKLFRQINNICDNILSFILDINTENEVVYNRYNIFLDNILNECNELSKITLGPFIIYENMYLAYMLLEFGKKNLKEEELATKAILIFLEDLYALLDKIYYAKENNVDKKEVYKYIEKQNICDYIYEYMDKKVKIKYLSKDKFINLTSEFFSKDAIKDKAYDFFSKNKKKKELKNYYH